jgi:hypothetical protein
MTEQHTIPFDFPLQHLCSEPTFLSRFKENGGQGQIRARADQADGNPLTFFPPPFHPLVSRPQSYCALFLSTSSNARALRTLLLGGDLARMRETELFAPIALVVQHDVSTGSPVE